MGSKRPAVSISLCSARKSTKVRASTVYSVLFLLFLATGEISAWSAEKRPIDAIEDNSFLLEEAYNQEAGVVQHIWTATYSADSRYRGWTFNFSQEWPIFSQDHQFSYSVPSYRVREVADRIHGVGDIILNYRYQALAENAQLPAFAPRFTLILPTGNRDRGTGEGVVGYQWGLPFSKKLGSRFATHANLAVTYLPHARTRLGGSTRPLSPRHSLTSYTLAASGIFALLPRLHLMLEWTGEFEESISDNGKSRHSFQPTLAPGFRSAVVDAEKLQVVLGAAAPIGLNRRADNFGVLLYLSIEHDVR